MSQLTLPIFIQPMLAKRSVSFDDQDYLFEIKWDGIRMLAFIDHQGYCLCNRYGINTTDRYPEFAFLAGLPPGTVLDGEMVVLDNGKPNLALAQSRDKTRSAFKIRTLSQAQPATYIAFDLLYQNHEPLLKQPLSYRRQCLERLLRPRVGPRLAFSQGLIGKGNALFSQVCQQQLEGIMAKKLTSTYQPGRRGADWLKIKKHYHDNDNT